MSHTTIKARLARTGGRLNKERSFLTSLGILYSMFYRRMTVIYKIKKFYIFLLFIWLCTLIPLTFIKLEIKEICFKIAFDIL